MRILSESILALKKKKDGGLGFSPPSLEEVDRSYMALKSFFVFFLFLILL